MDQIKDFIKSLKKFTEVRVYVPIIFTIAFMVYIIDILGSDLDFAVLVSSVIFYSIIIIITIVVYIFGQKNRIAINILYNLINDINETDQNVDLNLSDMDVQNFVSKNKLFYKYINLFIIFLFFILLTSSFQRFIENLGIIYYIIQGSFILLTIIFFILFILKYRLCYKLLLDFTPKKS